MLRRLAALSLIFVTALLPAVSFAQSDTGEITITVLDTATGKALDDARVFLAGPVMASALTQRTGIVKYTDVPTGIYSVRVFRRGYDGARSREFEVLGGKDVTIKFALSESQNGPSEPGNLRVIGSVTVRSNVQINTNDISDESPIRRLSDSMLDALDKLAGVSVDQASNDPDAAVTISLNGHDESQTAISLDGIPLGVPGTATNMRGMNSDLFAGSSTSFAPTAAGLGGGVNFRTLEPTKSWNERLAMTYGTYDRWNYQVSATGSVGPLGIAVMHTDRGGNNPLTFQNYEDASGLTYPHGGYTENLGDLIKLRYRIGDLATITGSYLSSNGSIAQLCTQWVTVLPCGIGPNNNTFNKFELGYLTASSLIGNVALTTTAFDISSTNLVDDLNRYIAGTPDPSQSTSKRRTGGYAFTASVGHNKHTISMSGNIFSATNEFTPLPATAFVTPSTIGVNAHQVNVADTIKSTDKLSLNFNASLADTSGVGYSVLGGTGATWKPTSSDTYLLALNLGSAQPPPTTPRTFSDPTTARFNCNAGTAIVSGPGDTGSQQQSSFSYNFDWTHLWRTGQITVNAYRQTQIGQTINALINEAGEPAGYFPPGYLAAVGTTWAQPTICGSATFNPLGVYVTQPIMGTARVYQGIDVSGRIALGRNVVVLPTYALNSAVLVAADSRLTSAPSTSIVGAQLPGRPLHRAGITVDANLPRSEFELLANAQYTGGNNNRNLVPYATVNWGISHPVGSGRLTLFETNAFNAVAGAFSTLEYGEPVPVNGGGVVFFAANPLLPRTISLNYTVTLGKSAQRPLSSLQQQARFAGREGRFGGPPGPFARPNVLPPGGDPLSLATNNPLCNAEAQAIAKPLLDGLRAYVAAYETHAALPPTPGFIVTAHANGAAGVPYWLEIRPEGSSPPGERRQTEPRLRFRAIFACEYIARLTTEEAKTKGIDVQGRLGMGYAPGVGIFAVIPRQLPQGVGSLRP